MISPQSGRPQRKNCRGVSWWCRASCPTVVKAGVGRARCPTPPIPNDWILSMRPTSADGKSKGQRESQPRPNTWPPTMPVAVLRAPTVHAIFRIAAKNRSTMTGLLEALGILPGEEFLLVELWERDGCSQSELASALGLDRARLSKMLQ